MGFQLHGRRLLVVGLGRIGTQVALRAKAFGMEVSAYDPYVSAARMESLGVKRREDLRRALGLADIVTLHVPATTETKGIIGREEFDAMRAGACLINCARGKVVDEAALLAALESGRLAAAALDVTVEEPLPAGSPLWRHPRVFITPHTAGETRKYEDNVLDMLEENLRRMAAGQPLLNQVVG